MRQPTDFCETVSAENDSPARAELVGVVVRAQSGDMAAQSDLVRRYTGRLSAYVRSLIGQPSSVEDIVQMVFIKMIRRLPAVREPGFFESWIYTLSRNTAFDFVRRQRRRIFTVSAEDELLSMPETNNAFAVHEIMDALDGALFYLKPRDRRLVALLVNGHSYEAVAEIEGLTLGTVKTRVNRLRAALRERVGEAVGLAVKPKKALAAHKVRLAA